MSLRHHAFIAVGTSLFLSFASDGVRLVTMMIMARLLTPAEYGTFAMTHSVFLWIGAFGFMNFAPNLLRERSQEGELSSYILFGAILHAGLAIIGICAAGVLYFLLDQAVVGALLAVAVLAFPLEVPAEMEQQLLQREFSWKRLRLVQLTTLVGGSLISVALAWNGWGPFALVISVVLGPIPFALLLVLSRDLRPLRWDRQILTRLQRFGWPMVAGSIAWRTRELVSSWGVGVVLGAAQLGLLGRATGLAGLVLGRFSGQVSNALLPILARVQEEPARKRRVGVLLLRATTWIQVPLAVCLILLSEPAVHILYGGQWEDVAGLLPFATAVALVQTQLKLFIPLLIASGATSKRLVCDLINLAGSVGALAVLSWGLQAYLLAQTVAVLCTTLYAGHVVSRDGWFDAAAVRDAMIPAASGALAGGAVAILISLPFTGAVAGGIGAATFCTVYGLTIRFAFAGALDELLIALPGGERLRRMALLAPAHRSRE